MSKVRYKKINDFLEGLTEGEKHFIYKKLNKKFYNIYDLIDPNFTIKRGGLTYTIDKKGRASFQKIQNIV